MILIELLAVIVIGVGFGSGFGTRALIPLLRRNRIVDEPNERSLHDAATPRGGGIAPIVAILVVWFGFAAAGWNSAARWAVLLGAVVLAVLSWFDDRTGVTAGGRLAVQIIVVGLSLYARVLPGLVFHGVLPPLADYAATAILWLWFLNLFNFMDGADGLAGSEAAAIGVGLALLGAVGAAHDPAAAALGVAIAAAAVGFLFSNWAPALVFMGDVGSIPLGYLIGFLLLRLAAQGHWKAALILPLYFLADATITLVWRAARREPVWEPHRKHFYQRAVLRGLGHARMVACVIAADLLLIGCAWAAENGWGAWALIPAVAIVAILLVVLSLPRYTRPRKSPNRSDERLVEPDPPRLDLGQQ